jgi:peptide/nickel transport system substrate-binding protein
MRDRKPGRGRSARLPARVTKPNASQGHDLGNHVRHLVGKVVPLFLFFALIPASGCIQRGLPGTLTIAIEQPPRGFDPRFSSGNSHSARVMQLLYDTLVTKDHQFDFVPWLAESYEESDDRSIFTFRLRSGVKFHSGKPLTSADVKYTFETILSPSLKSPIRGLLDRIIAIETPDPLTVVFRSREPFYSFIGNLPAIGIIPDGAGAEIIDSPVGTGPYRFVSYREGEPIRLEANSEYWDGGPSVQKVEIVVIPDNSTRQAALIAGEVDLAYNAQFDPETNRALDGRRGLQVLTGDGPNIAHLGVNVTAPFLSNKKVRRAISHALDRESIIHNLLRDQARRADSVLPPEQWAYEPGVTVYDYDPEKSRRLLDEAGYLDPDGDGPDLRFEIAFMTLTTQLSRNIAAIAQEQLRRVGIGVRLESLESATFFDRLTNGRFDLYYLISIGGNQSPDIFQFVYHSRYRNGEFSDTIARLRGATGPAQMRPLFDRLEAMLDREAQGLQSGTQPNAASYCPNGEVSRLVREAKALDSESASEEKKALYLSIAGLLTDRGGANRSRYCNPEIDRLIVKAETAATRDEKREIYSAIQKMLSDELPQIYLWYPANILIATPRVGAIKIDASGSWFFVRKLTLE